MRPALLPVKTAQFTQFFRQVWRHTAKSLSLTESVLARFVLLVERRNIIRDDTHSWMKLILLVFDAANITFWFSLLTLFWCNESSFVIMQTVKTRQQLLLSYTDVCFRQYCASKFCSNRSVGYIACNRYTKFYPSVCQWSIGCRFWRHSCRFTASSHVPLLHNPLSTSVSNFVFLRPRRRLPSGDYALFA